MVVVAPGVVLAGSGFVIGVVLVLTPKRGVIYAPGGTLK
jgi:hypothetical protein